MQFPVGKLLSVCMKNPLTQDVQIVDVWQVRQGLVQFTHRLVDVSRNVMLLHKVHWESVAKLHLKQFEAVH